MNPDLDIVKGCLKGKRKSQKALFDKYRRQLFMVCLRYASTREEAEDYLQEAYLSIFKDLHQYDPEKGKLITWMRRVTVNAALQDIRRKKLRFVELQEHLAESVHTETRPDTKLQVEDLWQCIRMLPDGYRTIFNLHEIEGYSHVEIAELMDISESTSRSQLFKAKRALREIVAHASQIDDLNHVRE